MCTGSRKTPSVFIKEVFETAAPSTTTEVFVFAFILVSVVLLGVTLLPSISIYETDFAGAGLKNLSIGGVHGVTNVSVSSTTFSSTTTNFVASSFI